MTFRLFTRNRVLSLAIMLLVAVSHIVSAQNQYGIPSDIQDGNILHCFNWKLSDIKSELPNIAKAGFGAVQISPMQRPDQSQVKWYDAYRPYDFKFTDNVLGSAADLKAQIGRAHV